MSYYTSIIVLSWISLAILCILVCENNRISGKNKKMLILTCIIIALAALSEWLGLKFCGNGDIPIWLFRIIKCLDYSLTPLSGGVIVAWLRSKSFTRKLMQWILAVNIVFQIITCFNDWMIVIDDKRYYHDGSLYTLYVIFYIVISLLVFVEFGIYGRNFRRSNRVSLYTTLVLIGFGIVVQETSGGEIRSVYLAATVGLTMLYIHNIEFSQVEADDLIKLQKFQILMNQIQPHFLFNCLSVIRETYHEDVKTGDIAITKFANYLRHNVDSVFEKNLVSFNEELNHVESYIALQKLRFGDELNVEYELEATDFNIPTLTLQPIVENAITYGVRKLRNHNGIIKIKTKDCGDNIEISVIDNGPGFDSENINDDENRSHIGIKNVRERLGYACGGKLLIDSIIGRGTTVKVIIPKKSGGGE